MATYGLPVAGSLSPSQRLNAKSSQLAVRNTRRRTFCPVRAEAQNVSLNPLEKAINALSVFVNTSPINEGKKRFMIGLAGRYDSEGTRRFIEQSISSSKVVVFSWTFCPFARKAKQLLTDLGVQFTAVELNERPDGKAIRAELTKMTNRTSVPSVFIGGKSYGGCNDGPGIATLHSQGKLVGLLQQAGAL